MGGTGQGSCDRCGAPKEFWGWPGRARPFLSVGACACAFLQPGGVATSVV